MLACEKRFERYLLDTLLKSHYSKVNQYGNRCDQTNAICLIVFVLTYKFIEHFTLYILLLGIDQI